jgi:hypothetical protein
MNKIKYDMIDTNLPKPWNCDERIVITNVILVDIAHSLSIIANALSKGD